MAVDVPRHAAVAEPRGEVEDLGGGREDGVRRCGVDLERVDADERPGRVPDVRADVLPVRPAADAALERLDRLVFRVDPDAGNGALEWAFAAVALGVAAASGAVAHRDRPRPHEPVEQA
jgi:hypothetical protein